jgi:hypothetical protein
MAFVNGDILKISFSHPIVGNGILEPKSNESGTFDPGGFRTNDDANQVTGSGKMIRQLNNTLPSFETPPIAWDASSETIENLAKLHASPVLADWTIEFITDVVLSGKGCPVGDLQADTNASTFALKIAFEGKVNKL